MMYRHPQPRRPVHGAHRYITGTSLIVDGGIIVNAL
jgi:hypothetical protein